jgi:outer membrane protein OmpA-like peptidoglycan-associated protein
MRRAHRITSAVVGLAGLTVICSGCATVAAPPEIEIARVALQDARDAGAERLVTRRFDEAAEQLAMAERTWRDQQNRTLAAHQASLAEAAAREAQWRARLVEAEQAVVRNRERRARTEAAVKDAEIAVLAIQSALRGAEQLALESEMRAKETQERLAEQLAKLESELERREAALRTTTEQTAVEREKAAAEVAKLRGDLTKARADAAAAAKAAEVERERLAEQRRANEARAAELARLQLQQEQLRRQQEETQKKLSATLAELADVREEARGLIVSLPGSIYFDFDKADVRAEMQGRLVEIAKVLSAVDRGSLLIEGHTDSDGTGDYNLRLSELRAGAVRTILVGAGVSSDRVRAVGYGEARPRVPNTTAAAKAQNRRVEIVIEAMGRPTSR